MTIAYCFVILLCIAVSGMLGVQVGRTLERNDCQRRMRRQHVKHSVVVIRKTDLAYGRGKVFGYELQARRIAREGASTP